MKTLKFVGVALQCCCVCAWVSVRRFTVAMSYTTTTAGEGDNKIKAVGKKAGALILPEWLFVRGVNGDNSNQ